MTVRCRSSRPSSPRTTTSAYLRRGARQRARAGLPGRPARGDRRRRRLDRRNARNRAGIRAPSRAGKSATSARRTPGSPPRPREDSHEARGDLITLLDADDAWLTSRTRLLVSALARHPRAGLVYGDMEVIDGEGRTLAPSWFRSRGRRLSAGRRTHLLRSNFVIAPSLMVRQASATGSPDPSGVPDPGLVHGRAGR